MSQRRIGILTTDNALVVTSWDAVLAEMTGRAAADVHGRRLDEVVPDLDARGLVALFFEVIETGAARVLAPALHGY